MVHLAPAKRRPSPASVCRIAYTIAAALILFFVFCWEDSLLSVPYRRKHAHAPQPQQLSFHNPAAPSARAPAPAPASALVSHAERHERPDELELVEHDDSLHQPENIRHDNDDDGDDNDNDNDSVQDASQTYSKHDANQPTDAAEDPAGVRSNHSSSSALSSNDDNSANNSPSRSPTDPLLPTVQQKPYKDNSTENKNADQKREQDPSHYDEQSEQSEQVDTTAHDDHSDPQIPPKLKNEPCLKYIVYDKPVKTGSSAVSAAIRSYLETIGQTADRSSKGECTQMAQQICAGEQEPRALLCHLSGEHGLLECLRKRGYYVVTSVRSPLERWESAFLYNRKEEGTHYGIHHETGYKFFMENFPPCSLYEYYDGKDVHCRFTAVEERMKPIIARYDEIIDLYDDGPPRGQLSQIISKYLQQKNRSPRPDTSFRTPFDEARLKNETKLYNALNDRREEILRTGQTPLCN